MHVTCLDTHFPKILWLWFLPKSRMELERVQILVILNPIPAGILSLSSSRLLTHVLPNLLRAQSLPCFSRSAAMHIFAGRLRCFAQIFWCKGELSTQFKFKKDLISSYLYTALYSYHLKMGNPPYNGIWQSYQTNFHQLCVCVCAQISSFRQDLYDQQCLCKHMSPGAKSKAIL